MNFGISSYQKQEKLENYKRYTKEAIAKDYFPICIKKCIQDVTNSLQGSEKICLAKCIDRSYDFLIISEENINPYTSQDSLIQKIKKLGIKLD